MTPQSLLTLSHAQHDSLSAVCHDSSLLQLPRICITTPSQQCNVTPQFLLRFIHACHMTLSQQCHISQQSVVAVCRSMLQCVANVTSLLNLIVLQCVALCCSVFHCVAVCFIVLQCVALCCSVFHRVAVCLIVLRCVSLCCSVKNVLSLFHDSLIHTQNVKSLISAT